MAFVLNALATGQAAGASPTSSTFTATGNGNIYVFVCLTGSLAGEAAPTSITCSDGSQGAFNLVYSQVASALSQTTVAVYRSVSPASPAPNSTITANVNAGNTDCELVVLEVPSGMDTVTPTAGIPASPVVGATTTPLSVTLSATPNAADIVVGVGSSRNRLSASPLTAGTAASFTIPAGFLGIRAASPSATIAIEKVTGYTGTTVDMGNFNTVYSDLNAFIIKAAPAPTGPGVPSANPGRTWQRRFQHRQSPQTPSFVTASTPVNLAGVTCDLALNAPAGTVSAPANLTGPVANINLAAPAGTFSATPSLTGPVATLTLAAPAGTVSAPVNMAGVVAAITLAAPAGTVSAPKNLAGPVSTLALNAPAGTVSAPVNMAGPVSTLTFAAPAGTVSAGGSVNLAGVVSGLVLAAPAGSVSAAANLTGAPATLALSAPAGNVTAGTGPTATTFVSPLFTRDRAGTDRFWGQLTVTHSISILKFGSSYVPIQGPTNEQIVAADITYLGGHIYTVTAAEAAALTAAGYGAGLS